MSIKIEYRGWEFEFDEVPSSDQVEARYEEVAGNEITLPVATPTPLERNEGPYEEEPLAGREIVFRAGSDGEFCRTVTESLFELGATVGLPHRTVQGGAWGEGLDVEQERKFTFDPDHRSNAGKVDAILYDATGLRHPGDLDELFDFITEWRGAIRKCGRIVVLGSPAEEANERAEAAARRGLNGFVRTLALEVGASGTTANCLVAGEGARQRITGPLQFLLGPRSAYVNGQTIRLSDEGPEHPKADRRTDILQGKTALITGAARGIGRATAIQFAQEGAEVIGLDLGDGRFYDLGGAPGRELLEEMEREHGITPCVLDVSSETAPDRLAEWAEEVDGFDVVVHNAARIRDRFVGNMSREEWRDVLEVNLEAPLRITDRLLRERSINDWGRIIYNSSIVGLSGSIGQANYTTTKAGMLAELQNLPEDLIQRGITVNVVLPGPVDTRAMEILPEFFRVAASRLNALSQMGEPGDVANGITFLASPLGQGLNRTNFRICGGAREG